MLSPFNGLYDLLEREAPGADADDNCADRQMRMRAGDQRNSHPNRRRTRHGIIGSKCRGMEETSFGAGIVTLWWNSDRKYVWWNSDTALRPKWQVKMDVSFKRLWVYPNLV